MALETGYLGDGENLGSGQKTVATVTPDPATMVLMEGLGTTIHG
jgi:hypothetical protein